MNHEDTTPKRRMPTPLLLFLSFFGAILFFIAGAVADHIRKERAAEKVTQERISKRGIRAQAFNKVTSLSLSGEEWDAMSEIERVTIIQGAKDHEQ